MFTCFTLQFETNKCQHFVFTYVVVQLTQERENITRETNSNRIRSLQKKKGDVWEHYKNEE